MEPILSVLEKAECHFTWNLSNLEEYDVSKRSKTIFEENILPDEDDLMESDNGITGWTRKLNVIYELPDPDKVRSAFIVDEVLQCVLTSGHDLISKYRTSCLHVASAFKAFFYLRVLNKKLADVEECLRCIKPYDSMSLEEKSAILAIKAEVVRFYGPEGTKRSLLLLNEAVEYSDEVEWKISRLISQSKTRRFLKQILEWHDIEDTVKSLEEVLDDINTSSGQTITIKYFLALAYFDFLIGKKNSPKQEDCVKKLQKLCEEIQDKSNNAHVRLFCALRMLQFAGNQEHVINTTLGIVKSILEKTPSHVSAHITASKIYAAKKDFGSAAGHAQVAMINGGTGAAWLLLNAKVKLGQNFDEEQFFQMLLSKKSGGYYKGLIHLNASLYYFFSKRDIVKGAEHMVRTLGLEVGDPTRKFWCSWVSSVVKPLEIAYNQIVIALRSQGSQYSYEKTKILRDIETAIEETVDCSRFITNRNLVEEFLAFKNSYDQRKLYYASKHQRIGDPESKGASRE